MNIVSTCGRGSMPIDYATITILLSHEITDLSDMAVMKAHELHSRYETCLSSLAPRTTKSTYRDRKRLIESRLTDIKLS